MGIEALTRAADGSEASPGEDRGERWISASATRNFAIGDPILDWLNRYGEQRGFLRDDDEARAYPPYDDRTDFTRFIFEQGARFEAGVVALLRERHPEHELVTVSRGHEDIRSRGAAIMTFEAMRMGVPLIHQGVLWDASTRTFGAPDLLVRSDVLREVFPDAIDASEAAFGAPDLPGSWHYRVVDVKFTTLRLNRRGGPGNGGSSPAYKCQLHVYNRALGRLQGYEPPAAFLLGRSWQQTVTGVVERGTGCLERLGAVEQSGTLARGVPIARAVADACAWLRRMRAEGSSWEVRPRPTVPELYPNMSNTQDGPWHAAKREIAEEIGELSLLWQVGASGREQAHAAGVYDWRDQRCTPAVVGVNGEKRPGTLIELLDVNRSSDGPSIRPARIRVAAEEWRVEPPLEFYVDFETVSDLADDFTRLPDRGGQPLIFMIGCGHLEGGEWRFRSFTVDALSEDEETRIIDQWLEHMAARRARLAPGGPEPLVIHWSHAEVSMFETAYNSATARHPERDWPSPRWFDFLAEVMRAEPVVVRGAMGFGLKAIARALHDLGFIETRWGDGPADGLGAMVGAWWAQARAAELGTPLSEDALMLEIAQYNEVDCRVMMETVRYLRQSH
jgi:hypothetical protein